MLKNEPGYYKGHHKRDESGKVLSRAEETKKYRLTHPGKRKKWDAKYRKSSAGETNHKKYNVSEKGQYRQADWYLRRKHGAGLEEKRDQYEKQQGLCGVCKKPLSTKLQECHWDHHHKTGKMREVLHPYCNIAVGVVESELHEPILEYLKRHNNV